jgi:hypothetical protein
MFTAVETITLALARASFGGRIVRLKKNGYQELNYEK